MRSRMGNRGLVAMFGLSTALLVGCAVLPTQPEQAQSGAVTGADIARTGAESGGLVGPVVGTLTKAISKTIDGTVGGDVGTGRFKVEVPSGAFTGDGEITVTVPDSNVLLVHLHIDGVPNEFHEPVRLVVSWGDALGEFNPDPSQLQMVWFDEGRGKWVVIPSEVDLRNKTIWSNLEHFSEYGVIEGKAGW